MSSDNIRRIVNIGKNIVLYALLLRELEEFYNACKSMEIEEENKNEL